MVEAKNPVRCTGCGTIVGDRLPNGDVLIVSRGRRIVILGGKGVTTCGHTDARTGLACTAVTVLASEVSVG